MSKPRAKTRVSREQWLQSAMELFARVGERGLTIHQLAREVGVAKAGFYWHFKDRADLLDHMLDYWSHEFTEVITSNPTIIELSPRERLAAIMEIVDGHYLEVYEAPIRAWAANDATVAERVREVYELRLNMVRELLGELGFKGEEQEMRAHVFVCYVSNQRSMFGELFGSSQQQRERRWRLLNELLLSPPAGRG